MDWCTQCIPYPEERMNVPGRTAALSQTAVVWCTRKDEKRTWKDEQPVLGRTKSAYAEGRSRAVTSPPPLPIRSHQASSLARVPLEGSESYGLGAIRLVLTAHQGWSSPLLASKLDIDDLPGYQFKDSYLSFQHIRSFVVGETCKTTCSF